MSELGTAKFFEAIALSKYENDNNLPAGAVSRKGFKKAIKSFCKSRMSDEEYSELLEWCQWFNCVPDGYIVREDYESVEVIVFEVENRNPVDARKLKLCAESWFLFDCWGRGEWSFHLVVLDKFGNERPVSLMDVWYSINYVNSEKSS